MGYIFCIMGMSSTGKDTLFSKLMETFQGKLEPIVLYTTRPKRTHETEGIAYHFISESLLNAYEAMGKIIERRSYNTIQGIWHYATIDDGQINLDKNSYLTIVTLEAYVALKAYFESSHVIPLYIVVEETERFSRARLREENQCKPDFQEMERRKKADLEDFNSDKLTLAGVKKKYDNDNLLVCISQLSEVIEDYLKRMDS